MSSPRYAVILASLFVVLRPYGAHCADRNDPQAQATKALPGTDSISNLAIKPQEEGRWQVDFDYFFTGDAPDAAFHVDLTLQLLTSAGTPIVFHGGAVGQRAEPGAHHMSTSFTYLSNAATSTQFIVSMATGGFGVTTVSPGVKVLAAQRIDKVVTWPSLEERQFYDARDLISSGNDVALRQARDLLEELIVKDPKFDSAFVELARIALTTNWGPEGLHQAETLIESALAIRPGNADAKILLGYVYANEHRFSEAESQFVDAAKSDPPNVGLWTHWGELREMQGDADQAIAKYREAIKRPENLASYRARESAYLHLLALLGKRKDFDGMEALYKQRVSDFGLSSCYSVDYARFKLDVRRDPQAAIDLARDALSLDCEDDPSREILGLANYAKWAQESGPDGAKALNQAHMYLPPGPMALYLLASSESTLSAARKLLVSGESIDERDNEQLTALAYALDQGKVETAERLLQLGARPDAPIGMEEMPAALIPVLNSNLEEIRVLQRAGVDYTKLRYRGATALDFAKRIGNESLLMALTRNDNAL